MTDEREAEERPVNRKAISTFEKEDHATDSEVDRLHEAIRREKGDPVEGMEPLPVKLVLGLFVMLMWGGWYLGKYDAGYELNRLDGPQAFVQGSGGAASEPVKLDPAVVGKRIYNSCISCHQADGNGKGAFPPLNESEWVQDPPEVFAAIVLNGIKGPITVRGKTYNAEMPAWGQRFSDFEIAALMTFVRSSWNNTAPAVTEEIVAKVRSEQARSRSWSMQELLLLKESSKAASDTPDETEEATEKEAKQPADQPKVAA